MMRRAARCTALVGLVGLVVLGCGREPKAEVSKTPSVPTPPVRAAQAPVEDEAPAALDEAARETLFAAYHRQRCILDGLLDRAADADGGKLALTPDALASQWEQAARSDPAWAASMVRRSIEQGCGAKAPVQESEDAR